MTGPFDPASIHEAVQAVLAPLPPDKTKALAIIATPHGVKGVFSAKIGDVWHVDTSLMFDADAKQLGGAVAVTASW